MYNSCMPIEDIQYEVLLFGGLDSSFIAALAAAKRSDFVVFTIVMQGCSAVSAARFMAIHFRIRLVE